MGRMAIRMELSESLVATRYSPLYATRPRLHLVMASAISSSILGAELLLSVRATSLGAEIASPLRTTVSVGRRPRNRRRRNHFLGIAATAFTGNSAEFPAPHPSKLLRPAPRLELLFFVAGEFLLGNLPRACRNCSFFWCQSLPNG